MEEAHKNIELGKEKEAIESLEELGGVILELFQSRDPKIKKLPADFGLGQLVTFMAQVYIAPAEPDPTPRRTGTASSSKSPSKSRS